MLFGFKLPAGHRKGNPTKDITLCPEDEKVDTGKTTWLSVMSREKCVPQFALRRRAGEVERKAFHLSVVHGICRPRAVSCRVGLFLALV